MVARLKGYFWLFLCPNLCEQLVNHWEMPCHARQWSALWGKTFFWRPLLPSTTTTYAVASVMIVTFSSLFPPLDWFFPMHWQQPADWRVHSAIVSSSPSLLALIVISCHWITFVAYCFRMATSSFFLPNVKLQNKTQAYGKIKNAVLQKKLQKSLH